MVLWYYPWRRGQAEPRPCLACSPRPSRRSAGVTSWCHRGAAATAILPRILSIQGKAKAETTQGGQPRPPLELPLLQGQPSSGYRRLSRANLQFFCLCTDSCLASCLFPFNSLSESWKSPCRSYWPLSSKVRHVIITGRLCLPEGTNAPKREYLAKHNITQKCNRNVPTSVWTATPANGRVMKELSLPRNAHSQLHLSISSFYAVY